MTKVDKGFLTVFYIAALTFMVMGLIDILKHMHAHGGILLR